MHFSLLLFSSFTIFLSLGTPLDYDQIQQQLTAVSEQLDRIELHLNNSVHQLIDKIDGSSQDIIRLFKSVPTSRTDGESHISKIEF